MKKTKIIILSSISLIILLIILVVVVNTLIKPGETELKYESYDNSSSISFGNQQVSECIVTLSEESPKGYICNDINYIWDEVIKKSEYYYSETTNNEIVLFNDGYYYICDKMDINTLVFSNLVMASNEYAFPSFVDNFYEAPYLKGINSNGDSLYTCTWENITENVFSVNSKETMINFFKIWNQNISRYDEETDTIYLQSCNFIMQPEVSKNWPVKITFTNDGFEISFTYKNR